MFKDAALIQTAEIIHLLKFLFIKSMCVSCERISKSSNNMTYFKLAFADWFKFRLIEELKCELDV
jgi:hypothetical protein